MTFEIHITPELESQLREAAAQEGIDTRSYILHALKACLRDTSDQPPYHLSMSEAHLLQQINQGLPQDVWQRYHELISKRQAETLTESEQTNLIVLSDQIEAANARRLEYLIQLSQLRQISLTTLMQQLGIHTPSYV